MPILDSSEYIPRKVLRNRHMATMLPYFFRKPITLPYQRERITTSDNDFVDIDRVSIGSNKIAILCHGLEGDSNSKYIKGMGMASLDNGWDIAAMNYRGCSGEMNDKLQMYHSGKTDDLQDVIDHLETNYLYIALIGFSLGGNLVTKYAGEENSKRSDKIIAVVGLSVPCQLSACSNAFTRTENYFYEHRFMVSLKDKVRQKHKMFPNEIDISPLKKIKTVLAFDDTYTAPVHGYKDAEDYYTQNSCTQFINNINIPTLILNALDDPFLHPSCFPYSEVEASDSVFLLTTQYGGHVGFAWEVRGRYFSEEKTLAFINQYL